MANDIALIELDDFADINQFVDVVEMAEPSNGDFAFVDCFIIGWGGDECKAIFQIYFFCQFQLTCWNNKRVNWCRFPLMFSPNWVKLTKENTNSMKFEFYDKRLAYAFDITRKIIQLLHQYLNSFRKMITQWKIQHTFALINFFSVIE